MQAHTSDLPPLFAWARQNFYLAFIGRLCLQTGTHREENDEHRRKVKERRHSNGIMEEEKEEGKGN